MLTCKNATQLMSQAQDSELALAEQMQLKIHLAICRGCRNYRKQMIFLRQTCRRFVQDLRDDGK